jgi:hypothetical protein
VWCSTAQEDAVKMVMGVMFPHVERHFWWKVPSEKKKVVFKKTQFVEDDVLVGFVGYCGPSAAKEVRTVDVNNRSRMVIAPEMEDQNGHVASEFFARHSKAGDYVVDLACRKGAAALAAAVLGRNSFSVDIAPEAVRDALCSFLFYVQ